MKHDPRDLAEKWLVTPGAKAAVRVMITIRANGTEHAVCLAGEIMVQVFLDGWLTSWVGEKQLKDDTTLTQAVLGEAMGIVLRELKEGG